MSMTINQATKKLEEYQRWRRGKPEGDMRTMDERGLSPYALARLHVAICHFLLKWGRGIGIRHYGEVDELLEYLTAAQAYLMGIDDSVPLERSEEAENFAKCFGKRLDQALGLLKEAAKY